MEATAGPEAVVEVGVREKLLAAATALFARKGYAATTVREIVEAAGVTKPALYYYFRSKEGIFLRMMEDAFREYEATVARALAAPGTASERILRFLDAVFALVLDHLDVMRVVDGVYYGPPQGAPFFDFEVIHRSFIGALTGLVGEGMASGEFRPGSAEDTAWAIVGSFEVVRGMSLCHPEAGFDRATLARLVGVVLRGVLAGDAKELVP
ncbi:MAG TPA: TetR/AcrR family transcriptional regulator [Thermoanaerobaculaceae bacterium]|nr:TetR/AcrR family transcriptional regulator [Thermoanaerobaculaceae bacterium]